MRVVATRQGFMHGHIKEVGVAFELEDTPSRKVTKDDDQATKDAAVDGMIPVAFSSNWMEPYVETEVGDENDDSDDDSVDGAAPNAPRPRRAAKKAAAKKGVNLNDNVI